LCIFCCCFCCCFVLLHCDQIVCRGLFQYSYICWDLLCALRYGIFWRKFHVLLRSMHIVLLQDEIFCRHQLSPFDLWCHLVLGFLCWFFIFLVWMTYLLVIEWYYHCAGVYMWFCVFWCMFNEALTLGTHKLIIVISFWCIAPFISMKWPSLSHLTNASLKSTLSNINFAIPAVFRGHYLGKLLATFCSKSLFIFVNEMGVF
jgi:hypothetical protein